jgi:predicted O-methyltransferase YrrM
MSGLVDAAVSAYALEHTTGFDNITGAVDGWTRANLPRPWWSAGPVEAQLLRLLTTATGASNVLEVGTFSGVGALALATALPRGGRVTSIEIDSHLAAIARRQIDASPYSDRIDVIVADARKWLEDTDQSFDLIWIDAWKEDYPLYWALARRHLRPRGVIVADNVLRGGAVADPSDTAPDTVGLREFARLVQEDEDVSNVLLTVGDGVMVAWLAK